jgi:dienelactone hydrolase
MRQTNRRTVALSGLLLALIAAQAPSASAELVKQSVPDNVALGSGPFKANPSTDPGLPGRTVYAPQDLSKLGNRKLPIVTWANGGCIDNGTRFRWFLSEVASHGYLVLANGRMGSLEEQIWSPPPPGPPVMPDVTSLPPAATFAKQLIDSINWVIAENARAGSRYFGRIETAKIAVMGMSCGGIQAIEASADPRVVTTVMWNSGLFPDPKRNSAAGGRPLTKAELSHLHGSVAYISGDESDIAFENSNDDFERLTGVAALRAYRKGTPHDGTFGETNGGDFGRVGVAWLNWQLKGDREAARLFTGPDCGLCRDPQWVVKQKNLR